MQRFLCYNRNSGQAYVELSDSRIATHVTKQFNGAVLAIEPKADFLTREEVMESVAPDVQLGVWLPKGQGCRCDIVPAPQPTTVIIDAVKRETRAVDGLAADKEAVGQ